MYFFEFGDIPLATLGVFADCHFLLATWASGYAACCPDLPLTVFSQSVL